MTRLAPLYWYVWYRDGDALIPYVVAAGSIDEANRKARSRFGAYPMRVSYAPRPGAE